MAEGLANLSLANGVSLDRLSDRRLLLREFDVLSREVEHHESMSGIDAFMQRTLEMVTPPKARDAFDVERESAETPARYGKDCEKFLISRRLVEAGIPVVKLKVGDGDTHEKNFIDMREQLPRLDRGFHALVTDLHERIMVGMLI